MNKTKNTRYVFLITGSLSLITVAYGIASGDSFTDHIITLVCGLSLLFGSYQIGQKKSEASEH